MVTDLRYRVHRYFKQFDRRNAPADFADLILTIKGKCAVEGPDLYECADHADQSLITGGDLRDLSIVIGRSPLSQLLFQWQE